jgi:orotidine-5'-phosphate decarboxylase
MSGHFGDDLTAAIADKHAPVCVGLDPSYDRLPASIREAFGDDHTGAIRQFCTEVLQAVAPIVPAVKIQIAYFEVYQGPGVALYHDMVAFARFVGLMVIGDIKRNDIGSTARAYARAHVSGANCPDAVTVNGYLGSDGLQPFIDAGRDEGKGIFVLVRTSNPSAAVMQDFVNDSGRKFYEHMADQVAAIGRADGLIGASGFSRVGAVVGATYPQEARELRSIMPEQIFLVPGYGAQGATAADCAASFKPDGTGAIVNASRSVIYAFDKNPDVDWRQAVGQAAKDFAADLASAVF